MEYQELRKPRTGETSAIIRARIAAAREIQHRRYSGKSSPVNAVMSSREMETFCRLDAECESLLKTAMTEFGLSARAHGRILKVARTIADLDGAEIIGTPHLSEAIQYRTLDRRDSY